MNDEDLFAEIISLIEEDEVTAVNRFKMINSTSFLKFLKKKWTNLDELKKFFFLNNMYENEKFFFKNLLGLKRIKNESRIIREMLKKEDLTEKTIKDEPSMQTKPDIRIKIGIISARIEETNAVNEIFDLDVETDLDNRKFFSGFINPDKIKNKYYEIIHYQGFKGSLVTENTNRLIKFNEPDYLFLIGIAASLKEDKAKIGDIIVSNKIHYYEKGDMINGRTYTFLDSNDVDLELLNHFTIYPTHKNRDSWYKTYNITNLSKEQQEHLNHFDELKPNVKPAGYFCGEKIVNCPYFIKELLKKNRRGLAVDQESYHVERVASDAKCRPRMICIKSISDLANKDDTETRILFREFSARRAVAYLHSYLSIGEL